MFAEDAERWASRAFFAVGNSGMNVPAELLTMAPGTTTLEYFSGIMAFIGQSLLSCSFKDAEPLMTDMMKCVTVNPDPKNPLISRGLVKGDFEEVATILTVRREVLDLHLGFSLAAEFRKILAALAARRFPDLQNIQTSLPTSDA